MAKFRDLPQLTKSAAYKVMIPWTSLASTLANYEEDQKVHGHKFELDPDFQRAHVWDDEKRSHYVEFILRGGDSAKEIFFNCKGWMNSFNGDMVLVDGKQRLEAVRKFMSNELKVFGQWFYKDFTDRLDICQHNFTFYVNDLSTRAQVLQWYLDINEGGIAHTPDELKKVKSLLNTEVSK
jgi:hypothetical protein